MMNEEQAKAEIEQLKTKAADVAKLVFDEELGEWSSSFTATDGKWDAKQNIKTTLQTMGSRYMEPAWMMAMDVALDLMRDTTDDTAIEAPYRALALLRQWMEWQEACADGFNMVELEHATA